LPSFFKFDTEGAAGMMKILEVKGLTKYFGGLAAVKNVDLTLEEGEMLAIVGPNGAGKTTFLTCFPALYALPEARSFQWRRNYSSARS
jgi:branched-chain amino acid transport system ATP-binding protein